MNGAPDKLTELIDAYLSGNASEEQVEQLSVRLRSDEAAREQFLGIADVHACLAVDESLWAGRNEPADRTRDSEIRTAGGPRDSMPVPPSVRTRWRWGIVATAAIVALSAGLYFQRTSAQQRIAEISEAIERSAVEPPIAKVTGLSGSLIWTGDRGQIERDIRVGTELVGGTIEGMAPDSWFELEFNDGSTAMIGGTSMLTFSDFGRKDLHLKRGSLSASVVPQPEGKPMLIHTPSAVLKVLGTRFEVEAELDSTAIHVSEGRVQVKRLSDGRTVEVPARYRVVTSSDGDMSAAPLPEVVHDWKSRLHLGPTDPYGKWLPPTGERPASLKAIPFVPQENKAITLHLCGLPVNRADSSPVVVQSGSRFVVRGRLRIAADLFFGIRVARPNGEFAGKFLARQPAKQFDGDSNFEAVFHLDEFGLDPCVWDRKDELPSKPDDLIVTCVWAFTHTGGPTGLEVTEIELMPPVRQTVRGDSADGVNSKENDTENKR